MGAHSVFVRVIRPCSGLHPAQHFTRRVPTDCSSVGAADQYSFNRLSACKDAGAVHMGGIHLHIA